MPQESEAWQTTQSKKARRKQKETEPATPRSAPAAAAPSFLVVSSEGPPKEKKKKDKKERKDDDVVPVQSALSAQLSQSEESNRQKAEKKKPKLHVETPEGTETSPEKKPKTKPKLQAEDLQGSPDFQGWLGKPVSGGHDSYKQRWFELRGTRLVWLSEPNGKPKGIIDLASCELREDTGYSHSFCLLDRERTHGHTGTVEPSECHFFKTATTDEKQAWLSHLTAALLTLQPFSPTSAPRGGFGEGELFFDSQQERAELEEAVLEEEEPSEPAAAAAAVAIPIAVTQPQPTTKSPPRKKISLSDFELIAVIGRGSYGKVLKVRRKDKGTLHAMKVMSKEQLIKSNMVEYTKLERHLLASIDHPFIASLKWTFQTKAKLYLVMDFLQGGELYVHLRRKGRFKEARAKFYAAQVLLAFEYLHSKNILFRDLKPENVVLDKDGYACLTDFGMARHVLPEERASSFCGTDAYISPEMINGEEYGLENDWWSLGVLLYEMITGEVPWYAENVKEMYDMILKAPLEFEKEPSANARDIIRRLLDREKSTRLLNPAEIKEHPFFAGTEWDRIFKKEIRAPFVPDISDDTKYFDSQFTSEKPILSACAAPHPKDAPLFAGFSYPGRSPIGTPISSPMQASPKSPELDA